jgi:ribosomal protein L18E
MVVRQEQRRRYRVDVERTRRVDERADVIVVPGLAQADGRLDRADADDTLPGRVAVSTSTNM